MRREGRIPTDNLPPSTGRLVFRTWLARDWPLALALWGDARVSALIGGPFNESQVRERLQTEIARQRQYGVQYWPIFFKDGGEHLGCCGLKPYDLSAGIFELGFQLHAGQWGKGVATEAARAVIDHAFGPLGAAALFAGHHPQNFGSRRVLEKLGFRYTHDELYPPTGLQHRSYRLTLNEYKISAASPG